MGRDFLWGEGAVWEPLAEGKEAGGVQLGRMRGQRDRRKWRRVEDKKIQRTMETLQQK